MSDLVFICHAGEDAAIASLVCEQLEKSKIKCWIAPRDTEKGNFMGSLNKAIKNSTMLILIYSEFTNRSPFVGRELEQAVRMDIPILSFRISDTQPSDTLEFAIRSQLWVDGFPGQTDQHLPKLVSKVKHELKTADQEAVSKEIDYLGIHVTDTGLNVVQRKNDGPIKSEFKPLPIGKDYSEEQLHDEIIKIISDTACEIESSTKMDVNQIDSISVALPGPVSEEGGKVHFISRVRGDTSQTMAMRTVIQKKLNYDGKISLYNDANAAARAEYYLRNSDIDPKSWTNSLIYIYWSGGIGAGIVNDGKIISGHGGYAGEIGHSQVSTLGPLCSCGSTGCIEAYLSEGALKKMVSRTYEKHDRLFQRFNNELHPAQVLPPLFDPRKLPKVTNNIDIEQFLKDAQYVEDNSLNWQNEVIDRITNIWALGITNLLYHLDPQVVVFGGNLGRSVNSVMLDYIKSNIQKRVFISDVNIEKTKYNHHSLIMGAYPHIDKICEDDQLRDSILKLVND